MEQNFGEHGLRMLWHLLQVRMPCNFLCVWMHGAHTYTSEFFSDPMKGHAFGHISYLFLKFGHEFECANLDLQRSDLSFQKSEVIRGTSFSP